MPGTWSTAYYEAHATRVRGTYNNNVIRSDREHECASTPRANPNLYDTIFQDSRSLCRQSSRDTVTSTPLRGTAICPNETTFTRRANSRSYRRGASWIHCTTGYETINFLPFVKRWALSSLWNDKLPKMYRRKESVSMKDTPDDPSASCIIYSTRINSCWWWRSMISPHAVKTNHWKHKMNNIYKH